MITFFGYRNSWGTWCQKLGWGGSKRGWMLWDHEAVPETKQTHVLHRGGGSYGHHWTYGYVLIHLSMSL